MRGELQESRKYEFEEPDVKTIARALRFLAVQICSINWSKCADYPKLGTRSPSSYRSGKSVVEAGSSRS